MIEYRVVKEHELPEHADWENPIYAGSHVSHMEGTREVYAGRYVLQPDELIYDGDIEPDIMAEIFQNGVIERTDGVSWDADPDAPKPAHRMTEDEQ